MCRCNVRKTMFKQFEPQVVCDSDSDPPDLHRAVHSTVRTSSIGRSRATKLQTFSTVPREVTRGEADRPALRQVPEPHSRDGHVQPRIRNLVLVRAVHRRYRRGVRALSVQQLRGRRERGHRRRPLGRIVIGPLTDRFGANVTGGVTLVVVGTFAIISAFSQTYEVFTRLTDRRVALSGSRSSSASSTSPSGSRRRTSGPRRDLRRNRQRRGRAGRVLHPAADLR